ncbi:hypothetical protein ACM26V_09420 [Salipaludibacillus sp. HK11]|uniref:hypothetical protein n=1 Tax=Salipaludibacillus sp. HK11 TaxID=3394320 RepID=UPI0039FC0DAB
MTAVIGKFDNILDQMDDLFEGFYPWVAGQYDGKSGGFYYAHSSKEDARILPDIESTSQALNIVMRNDLLPFIPNLMKKKLISFYQRKQDKRTGYFYDDNSLMREDEVMVHRALGYANRALENLGDRPLHPLPIQAQSAPGYITSTESYLKKWRSIDLSNSWRGCDLIATSCVYIGLMERVDQQKFLQEATSFLASIQDKDTGLWGEGSLYERISGTFKLHTFYSRHCLKMPNKEKIYASILHTLRSEKAADMCYIRNPIDLITFLNVDMSDAEKLEIIETTVSNMKAMKQADGGFSREIGHSPPAPNVAQVKHGNYYPNMPKPVVIGKGKVEGDMNASTQATLIRLKCYEMAQKPPVSLPNKDLFISNLPY